MDICITCSSHSLNLIDEPPKSLLESSSLHSRHFKQWPFPIFDIRQAQSLSDLQLIHGIGQILFVGEDEHWSSTEFLLLEHQIELLLGDLEALAVGRVDYEDHGVGVLVIAPPVWTKPGLTTEIPDLQFKIIEGDGLDIEAYCGHRWLDLIEMQPVQNGSLTCIVQSNDNYAHLLRADQPREDLWEHESHF